MAAYNLTSELDRQKFKARTEALLKKGAVVSLEERTCRSLSQNAYLHLLIGTVAMEVGTTLEDAKVEYFKKLCNRELFEVKFNDPLQKVERTAWRSTASLSKEEMTVAIDRFKMWASLNDIYMPEPGDDQLLAQIRCEMEKQRIYL